MQYICSVFGVMLLCNCALAQKPQVICGHKVMYDSDGKVLAWYEPNVPGVGYDKVVHLAAEYIKTGCPIEPNTGLKVYFAHCSILKDKKNIEEYKAGKTGSNWPHNPAGLYAGMVQSLAVDYRVYSGDESYIDVVRAMLDHQLANGTTPANWAWAKVPFSSSDPCSIKYDGAGILDKRFNKENVANYRFAGDGKGNLEPDKVGELGVGYLKFYEITEEKKYLQAAIECADALAWHVRDVPTEWYVRVGEPLRSPWPFRVNAKTGEIVEEYCANVVEPVRLFDELLRIKDRIGLDKEKAEAYKRARDIAWKWLFFIKGPMKTYIWKGYFEDVFYDGEQITRVNNLPMETARYIIKHPEYDRTFKTDVPALIHWVKSVFGMEDLPAIREQSGTWFPMGSHTSRYGSVCALWYEKTGDEWFKNEAYQYLNFATYVAEEDGIVRVGPFWGSEVWFSDGYSDYIKHYMEALGAIPEWAPAGEDHLLRSTSVVQKISYNQDKIEYKTFDDAATEVLRITAKPKSVAVNGKTISEAKDLQNDGWVWQPLDKGGVLRINHNGGEVVIER
jgi:hypothetical protein